MMCIAHLRAHSGLHWTLEQFNRFYTMTHKTHAAELVINACRGCVLARAKYEHRNEHPEGRPNLVDTMTDLTPLGLAIAKQSAACVKLLSDQSAVMTEECGSGKCRSAT